MKDQQKCNYKQQFQFKKKKKSEPLLFGNYYLVWKFKRKSHFSILLSAS